MEKGGPYLQPHLGGELGEEGKRKLCCLGGLIMIGGGHCQEDEQILFVDENFCSTMPVVSGEGGEKARTTD